VSRPAGTYFVITDAAPLGVSDALDFCRQMPALCGVVGVPVSAFCDDKPRRGLWSGSRSASATTY